MVQKRMEVADKLLGEGTPMPAYLAAMAEMGCDQTTAYRYAANVRKEWAVRRAAERAHDAEARIERLTRLSYKFEREGEYTPLMAAEKLLAQISGVLEGDKHLHLHAQNAQGAQEPEQRGVIILPAEQLLLPAKTQPAASQEFSGGSAEQGADDDS